MKGALLVFTILVATPPIAAQQPATIRVDSVVVKGRAPLVRMQDGNLVVNAARIPGVENMTLERMLERLPGISTHEGLTLNGRGAVLYIDGVRQQIGSQTTLKALSGAVIGEVELISMPSAEWGVTSEAIINVKTKRRGPDGYYLSLGASMEVYRNGQIGNYDNVVLVLKRRQITFNSMLSFDTSHESYRRRDTTWYGSGTILGRQTDFRERDNVVQFLANLNWESLRGHNLNLNTYIYDERARKTTGRQIGESALDYRPEQYRTTTRGHDDLYSAKVEWRSPDSLRTRGRLSWGSIYGGVRSGNDYLAGEIPQNYMTSTLGMTGWLHTAKGSLQQDIGRKRALTLYAGFKGTIGRLQDRADYDLIADPTENTRSRFTGRERTLDLYVQARWKLTPKWSVMGYYTVTYTNFDLNLASENLRQISHWWNQFPYLTLSFSTNNYKGTLGYTTSMTRPEYEWMLPGVRYSDKYSYTVGNPALAPTLKSSVIWNNLLWGFATVQLAYTRTKGTIGPVITAEEGEKTANKFMNYGDFDRFTSYVSVPYELLEGKLSGEIEAGYGYGKLRRARNGFTPPEGRTTEHALQTTLDIDYRFTKNFSAALYLGYFTPRRTIQSRMDYMFNVGLDATYTCLKGALSIVLSCYDIAGLRENPSNRTNYFGTNRQRVWFTPVSVPRRVGLSIRWNFNRGEKVSSKAQGPQMDSERFGEK